MRSVARQGLLLILGLVIFGILTAVVIGTIWVVVRAPQLLLLGGVLEVVCWTLGTLVSNIASRGGGRSDSM